jgi:hypothetical protein
MDKISLPRSHVESTDVRFIASADHVLGIVIAPCGVLAEHVVVRNFPTRAHPGYSLQFELLLTDAYPSRHPEELKLAAASLALHAHVDAQLVSNDMHLEATYTPLHGGTSKHGVSVCVHIPQRIGYDQLVINAIRIAGQPLGVQAAAAADIVFPVSVNIVPGMHAPLHFTIDDVSVNAHDPSFAIDDDGTLYIPTRNPEHSLFVRKFAADGSPMPPLVLTVHGPQVLSRIRMTFSSSNTLVLASRQRKHTTLFCVDTSSHLVRWEITIASFPVFAITVLANAVVFVYTQQCIRAYRLSDGTFLSSTRVCNCLSLVADSATATVYTGILDSTSCIVAYQWDTDTNLLEKKNYFDETRRITNNRLMILVPGKYMRTSYLVATSGLQNTLYVFSLPDLRLVCIHTLRELNAIIGLEVDPSGAAIAVCDCGPRTIHIVAWPLPGMP